MPIVKAADEIASVIQYRKFTETALAEASQQLGSTGHGHTVPQRAHIKHQPVPGGSKLTH